MLRKDHVPINRTQAHSPKTDLHGNWEVNMVLIENTLNLLWRLRNSLFKDSLSFEYLLCAKPSSYPFHISLKIAPFLFLNYYCKTLEHPLQKNFLTHSSIIIKQLSLLRPSNLGVYNPHYCCGLCF